jgi:hypothetical protein
MAEETMTKEKLLHEIKSARAEWDALMTEIGEARMTEPGATGWWSVKDVMAHLTAYTRWYVDAHDAHLRGEPPPMDGTEQMHFEDKNRTYYERSKDLSLEETIRQSREVHERLVDMVESETEEFLTQPQQFVGVPFTMIVWHPLRSEVYDHSRTHMQWLREWLATKK